MTDRPVVEVAGLTKHFSIRQGRGSAPATLRAVREVSFSIAPGTTLGLVGESGSGKSTIGRILVGLTPATSGTVTIMGRAITGPDGARNLRAVRKHMQLVFQNPYASLDPRMRVGDSIAEPLDVAGGTNRSARIARIGELLELVGLPTQAASRFPHEFSGGQRQRIGIARALALNPAFIVCDEAVSALDVSMQAQVVNLLLDLQDRLGLSYLFIAHDLAVVRTISTHVAVLYGGALVETAPKRAIYAQPAHPYTQALLEAVPRLEPDRSRKIALAGEVPSLLHPPPGCAFHTRCPHAFARCRMEIPSLRAVAPSHLAACHLHEGV